MEYWNAFLGAVNALLAHMGVFLPRLLLALVVVLVGWLVAKMLRFAVVKALRAINFHILAERAGLDGLLRQGGASIDTIGIVSVLVFWLAILAALILAFNGLGLFHATELLGRVASFVPKLILAIAILALGGYFAQFIDGAVTANARNAGLHDTALLGRVARYAVLVFVALIALDQLDIGGSILRQSFLIILFAIVFALALAFGLAGRDRAAALLERWWPKEHDDDRESR